MSEREQIVAWLRLGGPFIGWSETSLRLRFKAAWLSFRRPWTFGDAACKGLVAEAIERGDHVPQEPGR